MRAGGQPIVRTEHNHQNGVSESHTAFPFVGAPSFKLEPIVSYSQITTHRITGPRGSPTPATASLQKSEWQPSSAPFLSPPILFDWTIFRFTYSPPSYFYFQSNGFHYLFTTAKGIISFVLTFYRHMHPTIQIFCSFCSWGSNGVN